MYVGYLGFNTPTWLIRDRRPILNQDEAKMIAEQGKSKPTPGHISPRYTEVAVKLFLVISPTSAPHPVWFLFTMFIHLEPWMFSVQCRSDYKINQSLLYACTSTSSSGAAYLFVTTHFRPFLLWMITLQHTSFYFLPKPLPKFHMVWRSMAIDGVYFTSRLDQLSLFKEKQMGMNQE